jgi:uncharacterized protein YuzE
MRLNYYPETDSLYIDLGQNSAESREVSEESLPLMGTIWLG